MQGLITSSLFISCALSLSVPIDTATSQFNKRHFDQADESNAGGQICESSSQVFTESDIQQTALRACHLLHQQNLLDACTDCVEVRPEFPRMFTGIIADEVGHNLHHVKHQKTHAHPESNYAQYISIDHHNDNDHEPHNKHFNEHETYYTSNEHKRPEHENHGHDSNVHIKYKHGKPSHRESEFHVPHNQHKSDEVVLQFPIHGQKVIHDSARMVEPSTSILMTNTCIVVSVVEITKDGHYNQCRGRPLSSLMPINTHGHSSRHKTSCVQQAC
ncbi:unnamed protein product [Blumeria hordei]|uniref:Uncharacterized protein n=1 Tax=Blumeria hordei TaxID=2867405 RepID=A0A383UQL2_BLUHO|nr:unnamed protein product [Blumeria hordei]